jgi:membrane-associated protein
VLPAPPYRFHMQTGLVVLPFLPGDSLLFVAGTLAAMPQLHLSIVVLWYVLVVAAIAGDALNYWIGHRMGPAIFRWDGETLPVGA